MLANGDPGVVMLPEHLQFFGSLDKYGLDLHLEILLCGQKHVPIVFEFVI